MKHRIVSLLLPLTLLLCVCAQAYSDPAPAVFQRTLVYDAAFTDVNTDSWYAPYAASVYEYGLMEGRGEGAFAPDGSITVAELLTLSARLHSTYENGGSAVSFTRSEESENWLDPYLAYLEETELLPFTLPDYHIPATRAQMASIFAVSLPQEWYDDRNAQLITDAYLSRGFITMWTSIRPISRRSYGCTGRASLSERMIPAAFSPPVPSHAQRSQHCSRAWSSPLRV